MADSIRKFHFYDLRAKVADNTSDLRSDQAASDLLGHDSVKTTQRHYLGRGKMSAQPSDLGSTSIFGKLRNPGNPANSLI
jgi:integrase